MHPVILQGGMGVGISNWRLAGAVAAGGQLGIVSGTALDTVLLRRLQNGDPGGHLRHALEHFPVPGISRRVLDEYYIPGGRPADQPYKLAPVHTAEENVPLQQLTVVANFVEVYLAKEGSGGLVGINYLEKIRLPNLPSLYGAMLAGVDYVCMGAGIPWEVPAALDRLARHEPASLRLNVEGATADDEYAVTFRPRDVIDAELPPLTRPQFIAIVSSAALAASLARKTNGGVNGFVVEGPIGGGHNAPPRGELRLNDRGEPVYGPRDEVDLDRIRRLGLPFWLAGAFDSPQRLREALDAGATGVQIGTRFAMCEESGLSPEAREEILHAVLRGEADVVTDPLASPAGFPFKVVRKSGSLSDASLYKARQRFCDLGYLRTIYRRPDGDIGYRCPAEPVTSFIRGGGRIQDTIGRKCLCNALMANIGLAQVRANGYVEQLLVTAGGCLRTVSEFVSAHRPSYSALDVLAHVLQPA